MVYNILYTQAKKSIRFTKVQGYCDELQERRRKVKEEKKRVVQIKKKARAVGEHLPSKPRDLSLFPRTGCDDELF